MWELTKSFRFEAAHALPGTTFGAASEEIHGHSFRAEVTVRGTPDPATGMVVDLGLLERSIADVQKMLDHKFLNKIDGAGHADAGKPVALHLGARAACRQASPASACIATAATRAAPITDRRVIERHCEA